MYGVPQRPRGARYIDGRQYQGFFGISLYICCILKTLSEVSQWCCVDDKKIIPIIVDDVYILVNPNLIL